MVGAAVARRAQGVALIAGGRLTGPSPEGVPRAVASAGVAGYAGLVLLIALAYFASALLGNALKFTGNVDALWPPVGVGIALLFRFGLVFWPGILLGDILADYPHALPVAVSAGQTFGNVLEVAVGALLLAYVVRRASPLENMPALVRMFGVLLLATLISAVIGTASLWLGGVIDSGQVFEVWRTWWLGDSCGALVIVPLALAWFSLRPSRWPTMRVLECAALIVAVVILNAIALTADQPLSYLVFPAFIWAALRFGARGGTFVVGVTAATAIWTTAHQLGPFAVHSISTETLRLQLYIAVASVTTLFAIVVVSERRRSAAELAASRNRLIEAADNERRRLERDLHDGAQQRLTALAFRFLAAGRELDPARTRELLRDSADELSKAVEELRTLAHGIHPPILTERGLAQAIEEIAARSSLPIRVTLDFPRGALDPASESTAYYLVAESVANAQTHSDASAMSIDARVVHGTLRIVLHDDGTGGARETPGSGLQGLRDRIEGVGGRFELSSPPFGGTTIIVHLRLQAPAQAELE